jgi:septal ring factor EnvC (AmiA/AmiB activator)
VSLLFLRASGGHSLRTALRGRAVVSVLSGSLLLFAFSANAALTDQMSQIRKRILNLEQEIVNDAHSSKEAKTNIKKIQTLLKLQKQEKVLGEKRLAELKSTVEELQSRKTSLDDKVMEQRGQIRKSLIAIERSVHTNPVQLPEQERIEAPRRKVLAALVERGITEVETLKVDLADADQLQQRISDEEQQLTYMFADLDEQKGILELNQELQTDILKKHQQDRVAQLDNYRKLKVAESQVEDLIQNFNARVELERTVDSERQALAVANQASREAARAGALTPPVLGEFARMKGLLKLPITGGKIITAYGRAFDARSGLFVFKKGIDIQADKKQTVHAVSAGRVAYSGELPDYGKVAIIDHGGHFYSLCAHLGDSYKKTGDSVAADEAIGITDDLGTPVYFEIRARNVAVNPLQWVSN